MADMQVPNLLRRIFMLYNNSLFKTLMQVYIYKNQTETNTTKGGVDEALFFFHDFMLKIYP